MADRSIRINGHVEVVRASADHVATIAERMRRADREEVRAASGRSPSAALAFSIERSDLAFTALFHGRPELMFGVGTISVVTGAGAPWLLGTDEVEKHARVFLRESVPWRDAMLRRYSVLRNVVDDRNSISKRWLRWLGFRLFDPIIIGFEKRPFRIFELRAGDV